MSFNFSSLTQYLNLGSALSNMATVLGLEPANANATVQHAAAIATTITNASSENLLGDAFQVVAKAEPKLQPVADLLAQILAMENQPAAASAVNSETLTEGPPSVTETPNLL